MRSAVAGLLLPEKSSSHHLEVLRDVYTTLGPSPSMTLEKDAVELRPPQSDPSLANDGQAGVHISSANVPTGRSRRERKKTAISSNASASSHGSISPPTTRRRRRRAAAMKNESYEEDSDPEEFLDDEDLAKLKLPGEYEQEFVSAVFNVGLKTSSPKVLMDLMPITEVLTTEHIKSHLQKYRLHHQRSREEFMEFYEAYLRKGFTKFCEGRGWEVAKRRHSSGTSKDEDDEDEDEYGDQGYGGQGRGKTIPGFDDCGGMYADAPLSSVGPPLTSDERAHHLKSVQDLSGRLLQEQLNLQSSIQSFIQTNIQLQNGMLRQLNTLALEDPTQLLLELSSAPVGGLVASTSPATTGSSRPADYQTLSDPLPPSGYPSQQPPQHPHQQYQGTTYGSV